MEMKVGKGLFGTATTKVVEGVVEDLEAMVKKKWISSLEEGSNTIKRK